MSEKQDDGDKQRDAQERILLERIKRLEDSLALQKEQVNLLKKLTFKKTCYISD
ncbi:MAG: hypothetical protein OXC46_05465 [Thaumarchaeota archaeon]|nr:hypothetical protein [Nitrososphaerota archaeon]